MEAGDLTGEEASIVQAIAALEAESQPTPLESVAERASVPAGRARVVVSRLLGELGLVQEVEAGDDGPYYLLSGRAGADEQAPSAPLDEAELVDALEKCLVDGLFPATTSDVIAAAAEGGAPRVVVQALRRLQPDRTFMALQEVIEAVRDQP